MAGRMLLVCTSINSSGMSQNQSHDNVYTLPLVLFPVHHQVHLIQCLSFIIFFCLYLA